MKLLRRRTYFQIKKRLAQLYGHERSDQLADRLYMMIGRYGVSPQLGDRGTSDRPQWDERDSVLITYGDMVKEDGYAPLSTLKKFCDVRLRGAINTVHLLPFYPWTSDGGFSVIDYREVSPEIGTWREVDKLQQEYDLMFDLVLNHCSSESPWFDQYIKGVYPYKDYFIEEDPSDPRLSEVTRPRPWPLLTPFQTSSGEKHVWTTFSADQVDLNWKSADVLFDFLDIFLDYISRGARIIRLDAVAFIWKELGTNCIHHQNTHEIVKLIRDVLVTAAPHVILLTETNVPHDENISYFGEGDEAHMVYNFALPPVLLHALLKNDSTYLQQWIRTLPKLPEACTFFNFTASHDGIGVRALSGIVPDEELPWIIEKVEERGGLVSYRSMPDGSKKPYELNITYRDALSDLENEAQGVRRFLCSQAIMLALQGIPGVYFHSIVGSRNWTEGTEREDGENRDINRMRWNYPELDAILEDQERDQAWIHNVYISMLRVRKGNPTFHPNGQQKLIPTSPQTFAFTRTAVDRPRTVLCFFNISAEPVSLLKDFVAMNLEADVEYRNILTHNSIEWDVSGKINVEAYQFLWIEKI